MNTHDRGQLNGLEDFLFGSTGLQRILHVTPDPRAIQMGGRRIDGDEDQFLGFLGQGPVLLGYGAKSQVGFQKFRVKFPELFPQRIPVTAAFMILCVWIVMPLRW